MKFRLLLTLGLILAPAFSGDLARAGLSSRGREEPPTELSVRTTAYTHTESDHLRHGRKSAAGTTLRRSKSYTSAAADWSKFPLGTKFRIEGMDTTFVVDDYGRALVGSETIDIYHPSKASMNRWGVRNVDIKVLEFGDFERSREILSQRTKYAHIRKMLASIDKNPGPRKQKKKAPPSSPPTPASPPKSRSPNAATPPDLQLASAEKAAPLVPKSKPTARKPVAPEKPEPTPAPAKQAPALAATKPAAKQTAPAPQIPPSPALAAVTAPSAKKAPSPTAPERPPIPAPALRKVQPLRMASLSAPHISSGGATVAVSHTGFRDGGPATQAQYRKRAFRPLALGAKS